MGNIIHCDFGDSNRINIEALKASTSRRLAEGLIQPAKESVTEETLTDHAAEPIKDMDEIERISDFLIESGRYRDNMLFIVGINVGLRASDLRCLRFCDLINSDFTFKESFPVFEKKTRNTRAKKKNRYIAVNAAVMDAVTLYLTNTQNVSLSDYLFRSRSNNGSNNNTPITVRSMERILKGIAEELNIDVHMSTHSLRKTFAYWTMVLGDNDQRQLLLLQKMFNHSSPAQTLAYIGLDREEMFKAYNSLNLGVRKRCLAGTQIYEEEVVAVS